MARNGLKTRFEQIRLGGDIDTPPLVYKNVNKLGKMIVTNRYNLELAIFKDLLQKKFQNYLIELRAEFLYKTDTLQWMKNQKKYTLNQILKYENSIQI